MSLTLCPMTIKAACRFVRLHHRHNRPPKGGLFAVGCQEGEKLVGVAIVGRPVARLLDDGLTCEVVRLATDGTANACTILYGASRRAAKALGYRRIVTYTLAREPGTTLKASGWTRAAEVAASTWDRPNRSRPNVDLFGTDLRPESENKVRWECLP
jgi:hypothetical protein